MLGFFFFFQAEDGIRDGRVTGVQTCALPISVAASMVLNYSLAPHAELARKTLLEQARSRPAALIEGQIFRNRTDSRTWFVQNFRHGGTTFNNVQVLQQDANDNIVTNYLAARAFYRPETKTWDLQNVKVVHYDRSGNI